MWDGCPLVIDWDETIDWDGLASTWPDAVIYINVPFSMTASWLTFALIQYMKGRNIIICCEKRSIDSGWMKTHL